MSQRIKKLLHINHSEGHGHDNGETSIPTSPYLSATPGKPPQTGTTPIHGQQTRASRSIEKHRSLISNDTAHDGLYRPEIELNYPQGRNSTNVPPGTAITTNQPQPLQLKHVDTDLSHDLRHFTIGGDNSSHHSNMDRYSENTADRNVASGGNGYLDYGMASSNPRTSGGYAPVLPGQQRYSQDIADRNIDRDVQPAQDNERKISVSRKPVSTSVPSSSSAASPAKSNRQSTNYSRRSSLNKPLPAAPAPMQSTPLHPLPATPAAEPSDSYVQPGEHVQHEQQGYLAKDAPDPMLLKKLEGVIDLRNTKHTHIHTRWTPAVTHETVRPKVHHIREEVYTREIHHHHVYHRILPVVDIEVLPTKHYLRHPDGTLHEIPPEDVPLYTHNTASAAVNGVSRNWAIVDTRTRYASDEPAPRLPPRRFTARTFEGTEGDYREWVGADGVKRSETWWVYPPTMEMAGYLIGATAPLRFDEKEGRWIGLVKGELRREEVERLSGEDARLVMPVEEWRRMVYGDAFLASYEGQGRRADGAVGKAEGVGVGRRGSRHVRERSAI